MKKFGLLGEHLSHSYSPKIHNYFFELENINANYDLYEKNINEIESLINEIRNENLTGINVTIPYKLEVMKYLDEISDEAKKIGAVNTVVNFNNKIIGYNTDYFGFLYTLKFNDFDVKDKNILVLGTGGASKAIYYALQKQQAKKIYLASIIENDTFEIDNKTEIITYDKIKELDDIEGIVNCTPVGMYPNIEESPLKEIENLDIKFLVDIIYNPEKTKLIKMFENKGIKTANGLLMLVSQALKSEELWNGLELEENTIKIIYDKIYRDLYGL